MLKVVLTRAGLPCDGIGAHSAKHTMMSWLAKAGCKDKIRKIGGGT